jgi:hypothetical protein
MTVETAEAAVSTQPVTVAFAPDEGPGPKGRIGTVAFAWHALRLLGDRRPIAGYGRLLEI